MAGAGQMPRVLVVGAGATGSCAALRLRRALAQKVAIEVWEKARGPGGRMSTNRCDARDVNLRADMGAQYLSLDSADPSGAEVADMLIESKTCVETPVSLLSSTPERVSTESWRHLAGVEGGVNDALKKLLEEAGAVPHYEKRVASIDEQQGKWRVRPYEGAPRVFDAVVLAVPGCGVGGDNLNKIHGNYQEYLSAAANRQLLGVQHDARWSFAFYLPNDCGPTCDAFFGDTEVEKIVDDQAVHLLCYQSRKTALASGSQNDSGVVVVAHSTVEWANRNARANGRDQRILAEMTNNVSRILGLSASQRLLSSKVITWKQCQVTKPVAVGPHGPCMLVSSNPPFVLAGDYFTDSSFGGCLKSGFAAADLVAKNLQSSVAGRPAGTAKSTDAGSKFDDEAAASKGSGKRGKGKGDDRSGDTQRHDSNDYGGGKNKGKGGKKGKSWQPRSGGY